jgi:hypothetical protein
MGRRVLYSAPRVARTLIAVPRSTVSRRTRRPCSAKGRRTACAWQIARKIPRRARRSIHRAYAECSTTRARRPSEATTPLTASAAAAPAPHRGRPSAWDGPTSRALRSTPRRGRECAHRRVATTPTVLRATAISPPASARTVHDRATPSDRAAAGPPTRARDSAEARGRPSPSAAAFARTAR